MHIKGSLCDAVRCGENMDLRDERAAAELSVAVEDGRHEWKLVVPRYPPVHDVGRGWRRRIKVCHGSEGSPNGPWVVSVDDASRDRDNARARHDLIIIVVGIAPNDPETAVLENRDYRARDFLSKK